MIRRDVTERGLKALEERGASDELLAAARRPRPILPQYPNWRWWLFGLVMSSVSGSFAGLVMGLVVR